MRGTAPFNPSEGSVMDKEDQQGQEQQQESQGHPAWQAAIEDVLADVPDEIKAILEPKLNEQFKTWDEGVNGKLQEYQQQMAPYKPILENKVPIEAIEQSLWLTQQLEQNPEEIIAKAIESFGLTDKFGPQQQQQHTPSEPQHHDPDEYDEVDLSGLENHPAFKQLQDQAKELAEWRNSQQSQVEEQEASAQLDQYLSGLKEEHGEFNELFVTALMANGVDAEEAIETYQEMVKSEAEKLAGSTSGDQQDPPPVVLGNSGQSGSGVPNEPISMGQLKSGEVSDLVNQMIQRANEQ